MKLKYELRNNKSTTMIRYLYLFIIFIICSCNTAPNDQILFSSNRNGQSDIFMMNSDGSQLKTLVNSDYEEWGATFIDKEKITFMRQIKDSVFRFQLNISTGKEKQISQLPGCYLDDKNVVYSKHGDYAFSCKLGLFFKKKTATKFEMLPLGNRNTPNYLSWSFDGNSILYTDDVTGSNDVYQIDVKTHKIVNLTRSQANDERGDLSPDGQRLVFSSNRHNQKDQDLFILNLETREYENITNSAGYDLIGRWSSDGKSIFYGSSKDGNWEIYRYDLKDKSSHRLTNNTFFDGDPRIR